MNDFAKVVGLVVLTILGVLGIAALGAYPTKWLVNYLFTPQALFTVFGVAQLGFWKALALNATIGLLFGRFNTTLKK